MNQTKRNTGRQLQLIGGALLLAGSLSAAAQTATPPAAPATPATPTGGPPNAAKQAIDNRKAIFTLIGSNFRPLGEVLQGKSPYDAAEAQKRAARLQFLAGLLDEAFPDISSSGDTRAKPEIWSNRADFNAKLKDFQDHIAVLTQVASRDGSTADQFKAAAGAVGQDCKGCHDTYRTK
jgi:cytochrome c556